MSDQRNMFYGATLMIFERAKILRKNPTPSEKMLWEEFRSNKLLGLRFKAQHPIDQFIVDFYCHQLKLVIELDGGIHLNRDQKEYDQGRTYELNQFGIKILRFRSEEVENNLNIFLEKIKSECNHALSPLEGVGGKNNSNE